MRHRHRRADAGRWLAGPARSQAAPGGPWHHVANELPATLPDGAHVVARWQQNWDGGPGLLTRIAVIDGPLPAAWPPSLVEAAERAVTVARARLAEFRAGWEGVPIDTCTWFDGSLDRAGAAASALVDDALGAAMTIVFELRQVVTPGPVLPSAVAAGVVWRELAAAGHAFPAAIDDPYGAFGPDGAPTVPPGWRHRAVADVASPFEPLIDLYQAGAVVVAIGRDEAVLHPR